MKFLVQVLHLLIACLAWQLFNPPLAIASGAQKLYFFYESQFIGGMYKAHPCVEQLASRAEDGERVGFSEEFDCAKKPYAKVKDGYRIAFAYKDVYESRSTQMIVGCSSYVWAGPSNTDFDDTFVIPEDGFISVLEKFVEWSKLNEEVKKPVHKPLSGFEQYPAKFRSMANGKSHLEFFSSDIKPASVLESLGLKESRVPTCKLLPRHASEILSNRARMRDAIVTLEAQRLMKRKQQAIPNDPFK